MQMLKISDAHWDRIRHHFPEENIPDERPGRKPVPARRVLDAVLWILTTGAQWHMLPQSYPNYKTVYRRSGIGRADNVAEINGRQIAIEAKYTDGWAKSPFNSKSKLPWAAGERARMVTQARNYDAVFDGIIYHTSSVDLAPVRSAAGRWSCRTVGPRTPPAAW